MMGQDNQSELFHRTLLTCLEDSSPLVRRNAALALVRFRDLAALDELRSMLKNWPVRSSAAGRVEIRADRDSRYTVMSNWQSCSAKMEA